MKVLPARPIYIIVFGFSLCRQTAPNSRVNTPFAYRHRTSKSSTLALLTLALALVITPAATAARVVPSISEQTPNIVRSTLTPEESAAVAPAMLVLNLRNKDELAKRIAAGEILSPQEMAEKYYPTHESWQKVAFWAQANGLTVDEENLTHMSVQAHGQVAQLASALQTRFARVTDENGKEFTSAVTPASVPDEIAGNVAGVLKLQPHLHPKAMTTYNAINASEATFGPQLFLDTYGATGVGDGTGQIIAIFGFDIAPSLADLTAYWAKIGSRHTLADVTVVPAGTPTWDDGPGLTAGGEVTMDTEIVTGLCPGATVRVYCVADYASTAEAVLTDLPKYPNIHQLTYSSGTGENSSDTAMSQYFMALAAQGVTTFASSGDGGSNPTIETGGVYQSTNPRIVIYPASDPYVVGVGGTQQILGGLENSNNPPPYPTCTGVTKEIAWTAATSPTASITNNSGTAILNGNNNAMSGGGISTIFAAPSWQTGPGIPSTTKRCVPDVAATANGSGIIGGFYTYLHQADSGAAGTSESAPIWAALCAILNQNLQSNGHKPVGLLTQALYPLAGTGAMNYVTQGYVTWNYSSENPNNLYPNGLPMYTLPAGTLDSNGAFNVGPTYDCITGIGTPNIGLIAAALEAPPAGLSVSVATKLPGGSVTNGSAPITLQATATGSPTSYQWQLNGVAIAGATGATEIVYPTAANQGDYTVLVTNSAGSAKTDAGTLTVTTDAWLVNLSARAYSQTGANQLIAGFATTGTSNKAVLIRGDGPVLTNFGLTGVLADPTLTLKSVATNPAVLVDTTSGWATNMDSIFTQVGAFALTPVGSHDTALFESLAPGPYTAQIVSATTNNGVALAEVYDADDTAPTNRLVNISARVFVGTGGNILIGGFVIGGNSPQTVVIRADGPILTAFSLTGVLAQPVLTLYNTASPNAQIIATNTGWGNAPVAGPGATSNIVVQPLTAPISAKVGAFALTAGSADSAMVVTLPPGGYTAEVSGLNNSTGIALVEIYELR